MPKEDKNICFFYKCSQGGEESKIRSPVSSSRSSSPAPCPSTEKSLPLTSSKSSNDHSSNDCSVVIVTAVVKGT